MRLEDLGRLQVYLLTYIAVAMVLAFWVLPVLVTTVTPLTYREVIRSARGALVTAFATGNVLVVLPMLAERARELLRSRDLVTDESDSSIDVIVPTSYAFPSSGLLLSLAFVPFAAWYVGASLSVAQYPTFLVSGLFSFFGGAVLGIPFLLDLLRIPADMFQLFITIDVFTSRFGTLLAATHIWVLALLGACAVAGQLRIRWKKMIQFGIVSLALSLTAVGAMHAVFTYGFDPEYTGYRSFVEMGLNTRDPVRATIHDGLPAPLFHDPARSRLDEIRERGFLRVAYTRDSLPLAFRNASDRLVGFDIDMAHLLAKDIGVELEFVEIGRETLIEQMEQCCDIFMSGYAITAGRTERVELSDPYMDATLSFIVEDHRRDEFATWQSIRRTDGLKIAVPGQTKYYGALLERLVPDAEIVRIGSPREFFRDGFRSVDAMGFIAEGGSAWTLVYPAFSVAVPLPDTIKIPFAYPVPKGSEELAVYVNTWIDLKRRDRTLDQLFRYWILGKGAEATESRWCIARDVLGWMD
jgi:ABC-type amino acid transport substrate-binding protein